MFNISTPSHETTDIKDPLGLYNSEKSQNNADIESHVNTSQLDIKNAKTDTKNIKPKDKKTERIKKYKNKVQQEIYTEKIYTAIELQQNKNW